MVESKLKKVKKGGAKRKFRLELSQYEGFFKEELQKEWETAERAAKRADLVKKLQQTSKEITKGLLILLLVAGVVTVAAVAPNIFAAFGRLGRHRRFYNRSDFRRTLGYMRDKKYITASAGDAKYRISITDRGKELLFQRLIQDWKLQRSINWDGYWHLVMFDIPHSEKTARDAFRQRLRALGLYQLQKSVFVYPDSCEKEVKFLSGLYSVSRYIRIVKSNEILDDHDLRAFFNIS